MNAIANTTLPSESVIIDRLEMREDTYNVGFLLDFLALIPEPLKVRENDSDIEHLYFNVCLILKLKARQKRAMRATTTVVLSNLRTGKRYC